MYKIAICDDDKHYINIIRLLIEKRMLCDTKIYEYLSGEQLINNAEENHNLIFLDIQMDKMDGNEVAKLIRQKNESAVLVFCTGTQMPTPESFKVQPFRYILKSSDNRLLIDEIDEIINEMIKRLEMVYYNAIFDGQVQRIPIKDILYITLDKYGSTIVLDKRLYNLSES